MSSGGLEGSGANRSEGRCKRRLGRGWTGGVRQEDCIELLGCAQKRFHCEGAGAPVLGERSAAVMAVHSKRLRAIFCICW